MSEDQCCRVCGVAIGAERLANDLPDFERCQECQDAFERNHERYGKYYGDSFASEIESLGRGGWRELASQGKDPVQAFISVVWDRLDLGKKIEPDQMAILCDVFAVVQRRNRVLEVKKNIPQE